MANLDQQRSEAIDEFVQWDIEQQPVYALSKMHVAYNEGDPNTKIV